MYVERQVGNLCRMHALNAFFGRREITPERFRQYIAEYRLELKDRYGSLIQTSSEHDDVIPPNQNTLVSYILGQYGIVTRYFPPSLRWARGRRANARIVTDDRETALTQDQMLECLSHPFVFVFHPNHIWGVRRDSSLDGEWFTLDSLSARPRKLGSAGQLEQLIRSGIGLIVPVDARTELSRLSNLFCSADLEMLVQEWETQKLCMDGYEIIGDRLCFVLELSSKKQPSDTLQDWRDFIRRFAMAPGDYDNIRRVVDLQPKMCNLVNQALATNEEDRRTKPDQRTKPNHRSEKHHSEKHYSEKRHSVKRQAEWTDVFRVMCCLSN